MEEALASLCRLLKLHYKKKTILLLDEYDAPILSACEKGYYEECVDFMRGLMKGSYRVESNRESGYGRFGLAFFPSKEGAPGAILELKATKSEEELV